VEFACRRGANLWWTAAEGLAGLDALVNTFKGSGQDGETFVSATLATRSITLDGRMQVYSKAARERLLRVFSPKEPGRLVYTCGEETAYIDARIAAAPRFSDERCPGVTVSLICPDPFWRLGDGSSPGVTTVAQWISALEFPAELTQEWEIEYKTKGLIVNVVNEGSVNAGMIVDFEATAANADPALIHVSTQKTLKVSYPMETGDVIRINTNFAQKSAVLIRGGVETNIFAYVQGIDMMLAPGDNLLRYSAADTDNLEVTIKYDHLLLGV